MIHLVVAGVEDCNALGITVKFADKADMGVVNPVFFTAVERRCLAICGQKMIAEAYAVKPQMFDPAPGDQVPSIVPDHHDAAAAAVFEVTVANLDLRRVVHPDERPVAAAIIRPKL